MVLVEISRDTRDDQILQLKQWTTTENTTWYKSADGPLKIEESTDGSIQSALTQAMHQS